MITPEFAVEGTFLTVLYWICLVTLAGIGLMALISPKKFAALSTRGNKWIDTEKLLQPLDKTVDVDKYVLPFSRWLGLAVLSAVVMLAALYVKQ